ncbi:MAG: hypothetical protein K9J06_05065 [Flavobacteriales bacterium]|nr:hypothetical protein [Flavobacteriales bacterium]
MRFTILVLFVLFHNQGFGQKQKEAVPDKFVGTVILVGNKNYVYYALSEKIRTEVTVTGPGELTVYTRVRVVEPNTPSKPFVLKYIMDGKSVSTEKIGPLKPSSKYKFKGKLEGVPTRTEKTVIDIPPGKHKIKFFKAQTDQPVHARYLIKQFNKPKWNDLKSSETLKEVMLTFSSGAVPPPYYRITEKDRFMFTVSDTARIRILVRAEFTYKMLSESYLRLEVLEIGKSPVIYKFLTKRVKNVVYSDVNKLVPSDLHSLYLNLPKGSGERKFSVRVTGVGSSALIRISKDVNLSDKP